MKNILTLIVLLFFSTRLFSQCADTANIYIFTYEGKTYEIVKELKTWSDAAACAIERGGYLVEINDINEQNAVYDSIINGAGISPTYVSISNGGGIAYLWIGATDQHTEGTWLWDGNNDSIGANFWSGQGANGSGNGVSIGGVYNNWGGTSSGTPNEPDDYSSNQDHGAIALAGWPSGTNNLGSAGEWNDIIGSSLVYYIIELGHSTGIQDNSLKLNNQLQIYPNPSNGTLNIDCADDYKLIEIYDVNGQLLEQFEKREKIDITNLSKGTYFVKIISDLFEKSEKIVLN